MIPLSVTSHWFARKSLLAVARYAAIPHYKRKLQKFEADLAHAQTVQRQALFRKLCHCAQTRFGREHGFSQISTVSDFRKQIPITDYEYLAPYINDVAEGRIDALFPQSERITAFACTTGTTGRPKLNPVTSTWLREYLRSWEVWGVKAIVEHPQMIGTKVLQMLGPGDLGRTPSGLPIGMVSAIAAKTQNRIYRSFYAVPSDVFDIDDSSAKYYTMLRLAMASDVGFIIAITPANLIRLAQFGNQHRESLIRDIHDGSLSAKVDVSDAMRGRIQRSIQVKRPQRARFLEHVIQQTGELYPKDYWPLSLISCWLGGTIGYQTRELSRYYGTIQTRDLGLVSTEGRHTIPLHDNQAEGVLAIDGSYYEFLPHGETDTTLECHQLKPGEEYSLIMTTASGLYRYKIGDIVRCNGYVGKSPILEFLHKEGQCADMEGEKISGSQVAQAVGIASRELSLSVDCFMAVPVRKEGKTPYYALLVEHPVIDDSNIGRQFIRIVDRELIRSNVMYAGKRNDMYIDAPQLVRLPPGTWSAYMAVETGHNKAGDSQYKHAALVPDTSWLNRFQPIDTICLESASWNSESPVPPVAGRQLVAG